MRHVRTAFDLGVLIDPLQERAFAEGNPPEAAYGHLGPIAIDLGKSLVYFSPNAVDWENGRVLGWRYGRSGWVRVSAPLPRNVYNRIARRSFEEAPGTRRVLDRLAARGRLFNPGFLDKGRVLALLAQTPSGVFIPDFARARRPAEAIRFLERWRDVYLKPTAGSLGRGILRIRRDDASEINAIYRVVANRDRLSPPERLRMAMPDLSAYLSRLLVRESYIVQRTVPLPTRGERRYDVRALVQQEAGAWRLTGAVGRLAAPSHVTTHTVRGGEPIELPEAVRAPLEAACVGIARDLERALGSGYFEFSFDIAPVAHDRLFLLEVNAKPFPFDEIEVRSRAAARLFHYAAQPFGDFHKIDHTT